MGSIRADALSDSRPGRLLEVEFLQGRHVLDLPHSDTRVNERNSRKREAASHEGRVTEGSALAVSEPHSFVDQVSRLVDVGTVGDVVA